MRLLFPFALFLLLFAAGCATTDTPPLVVEPEPAAVVTEEPDGDPIGTLRVTASKLNVRTEPNTSAAVIASLKRGEKVALLRKDGGWSRVRTGSGGVGWVSSQHVRAERGCLPDRDFKLVSAPAIALAETGARGTVTVEAEVSAAGEVTSTRVIGNSTGDPSLAAIAEREIRTARFSAPVKNCRAQRFIYVYRKTF